MQAILRYKFSPGCDQLEEELRAFEGLVHTFRALFGEEISDSITRAVIKSQMPAEIRTHLGLQTFLGTRRTYPSHVEPVQDEDSVHRVKCWNNQPNIHGKRLGQEHRHGKGQGQRERERKRQEQGKGKRKKDEQSTTKFEGWCGNCKSGAPKVANCWYWKEKQVTRFKSGAASATASSSSSQISVKKTDDGAKEIAFVEKVQEDTEKGWLLMIADAMTAHQPSLNGTHSLVVASGADVHVCPMSNAPPHAIASPA